MNIDTNFNIDEIPLLEINYEDENNYIYNRKNKKRYSPFSLDVIQQHKCPKCGNKIYNFKYINQKKLNEFCDCSNNKEKKNYSSIVCKCLEHYLNYKYYCYYCEKNLCQKCYEFHKDHYTIDLNKILINAKECKEKIENFGKNIVEMEENFENIINDSTKEINNLKISFKNKMNECRKLLNISTILFIIYYKQLHSKQLTYEIIQNLKNLSDFNDLNNNLIKDKTNIFQNLKVSKFIKEFNILHPTIENKIPKSISKKHCYNIKEHTDVIQCLLILHDKRLVSTSNDGLIIIYNNNFQKQFIINIHDREVYNIIENKSNDIISCSADKKICIIQLFNNTYIIKQIINSHYDQVIHIREFSNLNLFSTSLDKSIKIWNKHSSGYKLITTLKTKDIIYSILELKKYKQFVCLEGEKHAIFYDQFNLTQKYILNDINSSGWTNAICLLDDDLLGIGCSNKIILFKISSNKTIKVINRDSQIICIKKFGNNVFCGDVSGNLSQWELYKDNLKFIDEKKNAHEDKIVTIEQFDNGIIVSGSNDNYIKIWR